MMTGPRASDIIYNRWGLLQVNCKGGPGREEEPWPSCDYWTQDGLADYGFSIEFQADVGWRAYIIFDLPHE
jgi:hypothetical protein